MAGAEKRPIGKRRSSSSVMARTLPASRLCVRAGIDQKVRPGPAVVQLWDRGSFLSVRVVIVVVMMMVVMSREGRARTHQKQKGG
jgi:hypothetical protein